MKSAPKFPALCLSRDNSISVADSVESLRRCNAMAFFKNRYFDDLVVIDADANRFRVAGANIVPALSTFGRWSARILNRRLRVELEIEALDASSLDEAKEIVIGWLDRVPDFWEAGRPIDEWKRAIVEARTAIELIRLFR